MCDLFIIPQLFLFAEILIKTIKFANIFKIHKNFARNTNHVLYFIAFDVLESCILVSIYFAITSRENPGQDSSFLILSIVKAFIVD